MGKGEASSAVGRGSDGTGGGNALRGKDLLSHLRGLESTVSVVTEAQERAIWERSVEAAADAKAEEGRGRRQREEAQRSRCRREGTRRDRQANDLQGDDRGDGGQGILDQ